MVTVFFRMESITTIPPVNMEHAEIGQLLNDINLDREVPVEIAVIVIGEGKFKKGQGFVFFDNIFYLSVTKK